MIFGFVYILVFVGLFLAGFMGLMPLDVLIIVPSVFRIMLFFVGIMIAFFGIVIIHGRAKKTGANHLLEFGKPGNILWFYVHRDGTIKITPSMREVEGTLYCRELDAQIQDFKSYRLFDHSIRFVPEGIGHAVDLDMVLYSMMLRNKYGYQNIREARDGVFKKLGLQTKEMQQSERLAAGNYLSEVDSLKGGRAYRKA